MASIAAKSKLPFDVAHSAFPIDSSFPVRILGIDPGLNITGYAVLERVAKEPKSPRVVEAGVVRGTKGQSLVDRLLEIHRGVTDVIGTLKPAVMALEQLYSHIAHPRTSILMGHARGVICLAAAEAGIPVVHYPSTQIKRILTGNGRASKLQMQQAIQRELRLAQHSRTARRGRCPGGGGLPLLSWSRRARIG